MGVRGGREKGYRVRVGVRVRETPAATSLCPGGPLALPWWLPPSGSGWGLLLGCPPLMCGGGVWGVGVLGQQVWYVGWRGWLEVVLWGPSSPLSSPTQVAPSAQAVPGGMCVSSSLQHTRCLLLVRPEGGVVGGWGSRQRVPRVCASIGRGRW